MYHVNLFTIIINVGDMYIWLYFDDLICYVRLYE